jgi:hypothetical protein
LLPQHPLHRLPRSSRSPPCPKVQQWLQVRVQLLCARALENVRSTVLRHVRALHGRVLYVRELEREEVKRRAAAAAVVQGQWRGMKARRWLRALGLLRQGDHLRCFEPQHGCCDF